MGNESERKRKHGLFMDSSSPRLSIYGQIDQNLDETIKMLSKRGVQVTVHNMQLPSIREEANVSDKGKGKAISLEASHIVDENNISKRVRGQQLRRERERLQGIIRALPLTPRYFPSLIPTRKVLAQRRRNEMKRETTKGMNHSFLIPDTATLKEISMQAQLRQPDHQGNPGCAAQKVKDTLEKEEKAHKEKLNETSSEDLLNDPLTQVFGGDKKGPFGGVGSTISRSHVQGSAPAISQLAEKETTIDSQTDDINQLKLEALKQSGVPPTQCASTSQSLGREATRSERECILRDWYGTTVATGQVIIEAEQQIVHGYPLKDEECKIVLIFVHAPDTPLPRPNSFAVKLGDVSVGGFVAWPKHYVKLL